MPKQQGHFDFGDPTFCEDSYVRGAHNAKARAALDTWQSWPGGVFALCGEAASGKSHLATIWARSVKAPVFDGARFDLGALAALTQFGHAIGVIDHAELMDETTQFALLTGLAHQGGAVLLVSRAPPLAWKAQLQDLRSRLNAIAYETLAEPDMEFLAHLIVRQSASRGFKIDKSASEYLAQRLPRTFQATRDIVIAMQDIATPTIKSPAALAQRALQDYYHTNPILEPANSEPLLDLFPNELEKQ